MKKNERDLKFKLQGSKEIAKKTTLITNRSMETQDIFTKKKENDEKQKQKLIKKKQKTTEKELCYRWKTKCICKTYVQQNI